MQPRGPRDLLRVDAKDRDLYGRFSLAHLTAYSVHWLNVWDIPTTYENVSVLNARLFPEDLSMATAGFPEFPDALRTNRSLLQMRPKYRGFATSDPRKGVHLTKKGCNEVARVIEAIGTPTFEGKSIEVDPAAIDPRRPSKDRARTSTPAQLIEERRLRLLFRRFKADRLDDTEVVHFLGFLGLYDHTPPREVKREFKRIRAAASEIGDDEFLAFMDIIADKFQAYLNRPDPSRQKEQ